MISWSGSSTSGMRSGFRPEGKDGLVFTGATDKTRLIEFGRFAQKNRRARGERRPDDFLGFTHCRTTRNGKFAGRKPVGKRVDRTLRRIGAELRRRMHHNPYEVAKWLGKILNGWLHYYDQFPVPQAVCISTPTNVAACLETPVADGPDQAGQAGKGRGGFLAAAANPASMAEQRFAVEVGAPAAHAGICTGGVVQPAFLP